MDKCVACQYYDRQLAKTNDGKSVMWGQCRRTAPMLHPINAKSYMIEGVWPHVRDDDWCGEWKQAARRSDPRVADSLGTGPLVPTVAMSAPPIPARPASATVLQVAPSPAMGLAHSVSIGNAAFGAGLPGSAMGALGRGD